MPFGLRYFEKTKKQNCSYSEMSVLDASWERLRNKNYK